MADIFLSYSSKDEKRIMPLVNLFEQQGWSVWWDYKIRVGSEFDKIINAEIAKSKCIVVVWSNFSVESHWVKDEAEEGRVRGILAPVLIDKAGIPLGFRRFQTANLSDWKDDETHPEVVVLLQGIREILNASTAETGKVETKTKDETDQIKPTREKELIKDVSFKEKAFQLFEAHRKLAFAAFAIFLLLIVPTIILFKSWSNAAADANENSNASNLNSNIIVQNENKNEPKDESATLETVIIPLEERPKAIVNIFEGGRPQGRYPYKFSFEERNIINYGRSGANLQEGTLFTLIKAYCDAPNAKFKDAFKPYLNRLETKDESLADDPEFVELLKAAGGEDPAMIAVQNQDYEERLWKPSLARAQDLGIKTELGIAVVYDSFVHIGQRGFQRIKDETRDYFEGTPITGVDERKWIKKYLDLRKAWLLKNRNLLVRKAVYRIDELLKLVEQGNWELKAPITIQGFVITD